MNISTCELAEEEAEVLEAPLFLVDDEEEGLER